MVFRIIDQILQFGFASARFIAGTRTHLLPKSRKNRDITNGFIVPPRMTFSFSQSMSQIKLSFLNYFEIRCGTLLNIILFNLTFYRFMKALGNLL